MCYCEKCHHYFDRPRLGPRKVLKSGFLTYPTYDLGVDLHYGDYTNWVNYYYYKHNLYCPKCGKLFDTMDNFYGGHWAIDFGEKASKSDITLYFKYCTEHPEAEQNIYIGTSYGYPGNEF